MSRPKGSKNKAGQGLPLDKRLKVLQKIIMDPNEKSVDRLNAIKLMTDMLSDKVKETQSSNPITNISFIEAIKNKPLIPENKVENIIKNIETKELTTTTTTQKPQNTLGFNVIIDNSNGDKLEE